MRDLSISELAKEVLWHSKFTVLEYYLDSMEDFLAPLEQHVGNVEVDSESMFSDDAPTIAEDGADEGMTDLSGLMVRGFISSLRSSFFVSLYTFLESSLTTECLSRKNPPTSLEFSDIGGRTDLERAKTYFTKVLNVYFPSDTPEWEKIQHYRRLRNCIVHNRSMLGDNSDPKLRAYIEGKTSLRCVEDEILLEKEICREAYETIRAFLQLLFFGKR